MKKYICTICGFIYDEAVGIPKAGIFPGTKWEELPDDWACPLCGAEKSGFKEQQAEGKAVLRPTSNEENHTMKELSFGELSALCSNLAKGCAKQDLSREAELFGDLAEYYKNRVPAAKEATWDTLSVLLKGDLERKFASANDIAGKKADRGALRALTWSEKVTKILGSLLGRYEKTGDALLGDSNMYVCEICGFVYIGDEPPEICPVCKVPRLKISQLQRR